MHLYFFPPFGAWIINSDLEVMRISLLPSILDNTGAFQRITFLKGELVKGNLKASIRFRRRQRHDSFYFQGYKGFVESKASLRDPAKIGKWAISSEARSCLPSLPFPHGIGRELPEGRELPIGRELPKAAIFFFFFFSSFE